MTSWFYDVIVPSLWRLQKLKGLRCNLPKDYVFRTSLSSFYSISSKYAFVALKIASPQF